MAGQGSYLGHRFEHLAWILANTEEGERLGVCFDPCHVFAAGYDIRTAETYAATMDEFDAVIGLDRLRCFHLNDSQNELGSQKDRHAHIGEGHIGLEGFSHLVRDPRFADHPAHLETPKTETDDDGEEVDMDPVNLATLRELTVGVVRGPVGVVRGPVRVVRGPVRVVRGPVRVVREQPLHRDQPHPHPEDE
jgi:deoxyribonuclease-4